MINIQPAEKQVTSTDGEYEVHSIFHTIQGEGIFTGTRAIFVRLAGCNLQCPLCDTDYTSNRERLSTPQLVSRIKEISENDLVVITGGEPFRQRLLPLINALLNDGYPVQLETNGTLFEYLPFDEITIICSPKTGAINKQLAPYIAAYKYILNADEIDPVDGLPLRALEHPANPKLARPHPGFFGMTYVQPMDEQDGVKNQKHLKAAVQSVMRFGYTMCLQTHKLIGVE